MSSTPSSTLTLPSGNVANRILWGILLTAYTALNWHALSSMVDIWWRSATYAHCLLVPFLSAWMIHRQRHALAEIQQRPFWLALPVLALFALISLIGDTASMLVVEQLAAVFMLITLTVLVGGLQFCRQIAFPLGYLIFAVPFGEQLVPWLQQITADFSVFALQQTGIPVFLNGLFIEIPSGRFLVAEACSGMRYLAASLAIGTLYGYLNYRGVGKRLLFCVVALAIAIVANGIRAYLTIIIAHLTDMQYGTGDIYHFVVGWVVYAIIMVALFWLGSYWVDMPEPTRNDQPHPPVDHASNQQVVAALIAVSIMGLAAAIASKLDAPTDQPNLPAIAVDATGWRSIPPSSAWQPQFNRADRSFRARFSDADDRQVELFIADYAAESQGKELINQGNLLYRKGTWTKARAGQQRIKTARGTETINWQEIRHIDGASRTLWYWYQVGDQITDNALRAKLHRGVYDLTLQQHLSRIVILTAENDFDQKAPDLLSEFVGSNWDALFYRSQN